MTSAFFTLHKDLHREGPGEPADVAWVAEVVGLASDARICDAACGPGADIPALLDAAPEGKVTAVDAHKPFIEELNMRIGPDKRVIPYVGDYAKLKGPFDLIWCAGAVYFMGIEKALKSWRYALAKGGLIAFSEPCYFVDAPSDGAVAFWDGHPTAFVQEIAGQVKAAGFETVATRKLSDQAWEAYYTPMEARIGELRAGADDDLNAVLDEGMSEANAWRTHRNETGYLLSVVRPV